MDPSGHCEETGDEACWGIYEQIVNDCPECGNLTRPGRTSDRTLDQESIYYLQHIYSRVRRGWRPSSPKPVIIGTSASGGVLGNNIIGKEKLINPRSGDTTYFLYYGKGIGLGGGGSVSRYAGEVKNLGGDNMAYSGNFVSGYTSAVAGIGATTSYAFALGDNPLKPKKPNVYSAGLAAGAQLEVGMTLTEYVPVLTIDKSGDKTWNIDNYFFDPEFKYRGIGGQALFNAYGHSMTGIWRHFGGN